MIMEDNIINRIENLDAKNKEIKILEEIAKDMKNDAKEFDGKPFNGETVAKYFGYQGAAIAALANIIKSILDRSIICTN